MHFIVGIDIGPESRKSFRLKLDSIISDNTITVSVLSGSVTRSKTVIRLHDNAFLHYCKMNYMLTLHSQLHVGSYRITVSSDRAHQRPGIEVQGGTLNFSSYVGSGPASTLHPQKYQEFQAPKNKIEILPPKKSHFCIMTLRKDPKMHRNNP